MPHRRTVSKGSFSAHFDELVKQFPDLPAGRQARSAAEERELKERRDIHGALFERAWKLDNKEIKRS